MHCRNDPCGIICVSVTYAMLFHATYAVLFIMVIPLLSENLWGSLNALLFTIIVSLSLISHARASYFDPGLVPLPKKSIDFSDLSTTTLNNQKPTSEGWTVCNRCETYRPPRSHHCRICKRCVRKLDHHCPWINNCVGEENQKYFILFLFYIGITCVYALTFTLWTIIAFNPRTEVQIVHSIIIMIESVLFGIFVVTVLIDQIQSILNDRSLIDSLKEDDVRMQPLPPPRVLLRKIFGAGPVILWFFPCDLKSTSRTTDSVDMFRV